MELNFSIDATILVSAAVSLAVSVIAFALQRYLNRRGKLHVLCELRAPHVVWFRIAKDQGGNMQINVPVAIDAYNSSYTTKVMRDIEMSLWHSGAKVLDLSPTNMLQFSDPHEGEQIEKLGNDAGAYSFSIPANDVFNTWLLFADVIEPARYGDAFDEVRISFVGYRGKKQSFTACKLDKAAELGRTRDFRKGGGPGEVSASFR